MKLEQIEQKSTIQTYQQYNLIEMGCTSTNSRSISQQLKTLSAVPQDTKALKKDQLPLLQFSFLLEDIKLRRCEYKDIALKFKIDGIDQYASSYKKVDSSLKATWRVNHQIQCKMTEYDVRLKFLEIEAYDRQKNLLGFISINLYQIWRGPYHLNLPLCLPKSQDTRVSFNFKISQGVHIQIDTIETQMLPNTKKNSRELYTFWIEPIINQQLEPAKYSYFLKIDDGKNAITKRKSREDLDLLECIFELGMKNVHTEKDITEVYSVPNESIVWKKQQAKDLLLPQIDKIIYSHQLRYTTLYLIFFHVVPERDYNFEIDSSCYISLSKLMAQESKLWRDQTTKINYQLYDIQLTQKTWLHGKQVGEAKVVLKMKVQCHQLQMLTCVRTQKGIQTSSPVFTNSKLKDNEEISSLKQLNYKIQKDLVELQTRGQSTQQQSEFQDLMADIKENLANMKELLCSTSKESVLLYQYVDQLQMIQAQKVLIDIASKAMAYIRQRINQEVQQACWDIIMILLKRGEFTLRNIGFSQPQMDKIFNGRLDDLIRQKIEVGINYCDLLNQFLETTLKLLVKQGQEAERAFVQAFCSYAYFRIPAFRDDIVSAISKNTDPEISEWRDINFNLNTHSHNRSIREQQDFYSVLFNWQHSFYKCLSGEADYKSSQVRLKQIMSHEHGWKDRLSKRRGAFFTFLQNLVREIDYVCVVSRYVEWEYLPGYSRLLFAFLAQIKLTKVTKMTDRFKRCLLKLLSNEKLLNVFMVMLMKKTNIFEVNSTMATLTILDDCFKRLKKMQRSIPTTFDYKFLLQGIKVVLDSDYEYNISKALIILYNHFNYFVPQFSMELILYLLSKYFFKFFFHWSRNLRRIFHTLVYAKVHMLRQKEEGSLLRSKKKTKSKGATDIKPNRHILSESTPYNTYLKIFIIQRFQYLMGVIREQILPNVFQNQAKVSYEHNTFKKLQLKVNLKRVAQRTNSSKISNTTKRSSSTITPIRYFSETSNKKMIVTKHKIYFTPEEMEVVAITNAQKIYVKRSVDEYKLLMEELEKGYVEDPEYEPELAAKKMKDQREKDLEEEELDQW